MSDIENRHDLCRFCIYSQTVGDCAHDAPAHRISCHCEEPTQGGDVAISSEIDGVGADSVNIDNHKNTMLIGAILLRCIVLEIATPVYYRLAMTSLGGGSRPSPTAVFKR